MPGNPTPDAWDSASDLTPVASNVLVQRSEVATAGKMLVAATYTLDESKDLLITFDIDDVFAAARIRDNVVGPSFYSRPNTSEAAAPNRSSGYTERLNAVFLVEKIEVAAYE
jgi:hypothetical protein